MKGFREYCHKRGLKNLAICSNDMPVTNVTFGDLAKIYNDALLHAAEIAESRAGELGYEDVADCGNSGDIAEAARNDEARAIAAAIRRAAEGEGE